MPTAAAQTTAESVCSVARVPLRECCAQSRTPVTSATTVEMTRTGAKSLSDSSGRSGFAIGTAAGVIGNRPVAGAGKLQCHHRYQHESDGVVDVPVRVHGQAGEENQTQQRAQQGPGYGGELLVALGWFDFIHG